MRAFLPVESAAGDRHATSVKFIRPASIPLSNAGSVNSQGDATHRSAQARSTFGAKGAGIKVGVLSTSINDTKNSLGKAVNSGDLPGDTMILQGQAGANSLGGEGLAMLELVHDLAPASKLYTPPALVVRRKWPKISATSLQAVVGSSSTILAISPKPHFRMAESQRRLMPCRLTASSISPAPRIPAMSKVEIPALGKGISRRAGSSKASDSTMHSNRAFLRHPGDRQPDFLVLERSSGGLGK